jgi:hypothetical protein
MAIQEFEYLPDSPAAIVGELVTGGTVTIEVWKDADAVSLTDNACEEIDATGRYSWSTSNLPVLMESREQYHWRMDDGVGNTVEGDFILKAPEADDGMMPSLRNQSSYIRQV